MTALQWIVKEAKQIKKQHPNRFKTWKEYVAQASAIYSSKHKNKKPVSKKHKISGVKKKTAKKKSSLLKDSLKASLPWNFKAKIDLIKKHPELLKFAAMAGTKKKKSTHSTHKDSKSHNVKINVTSGIGAIVDHYKHKYGTLAAKKLTEKTKTGKRKIAKEMQAVASKIKKLKNV